MKKEMAEKNAKFLADDYKEQLQAILEKNPIEQLEEIQNSLIYDSQLLSLVQDLLKGLQEYDERIKHKYKEKTLPNEDISLDEFTWLDFEGSLWQEISHFQQVILQHFFTYNLLQALFASQFTPLNKSYLEELLKRHKLTPKKLKDLLLQFLGNKSFLGKVKHGGSEGFWDIYRKLEFLALYNRFLIVIKNARRDKKNMKRKRKEIAELSIKKEVMAKYEIPETLMLSLFSDDAASDVALDWAIDEMKVNKFNREYLDGIILKDARNTWKDRGLIIDVVVDFGRKIYAVNPKDTQKKNKLRYTPLNEPHYENIFDPDSFLVEHSF